MADETNNDDISLMDHLRLKIDLVERVDQLAMHIGGLHKKIDDIHEKIDGLSSEFENNRRNTKKAEFPWLYFLVLSVVIGFVGILVVKGWTEPLKVSINFNVGEIIGGILVGVSALLAAIVYRRRE